MSDPSKTLLKVPEDVLATLRTGPPYVMATAEDFERIKRLAATDATLAGKLDEVRNRARAIIDHPVSTYDIPDGKRLLTVSREVLKRACQLGLIWRIDGGDDLRDRLWAEIQAVCAFPDWNPSHFLDTAEMAHAVAVAYDWLHDAWTDQQRSTMRDGLLRHALRPALGHYSGARQMGWGWDRADNNWNVVCNGGLITAAVALVADEPDIARTILREAVPRMQHCLRHFAPDGGWPEGPGYWAYTLRYLVAAASTLEAALGSDMGIGDMPGLSQTAWFPIHLTGPTGMVFNFSDSNAGRPSNRPVPRSPMHAYLGRRYRDTGWNRPALWPDRPDAISLLFYEPAPADTAPPARDARFGYVEALAMRSAWGDPDALFVAAQCGANRVGHNQADLGCFVLDALGQRWAMDLGTDDYNLPQYFGAQRYAYYRNRAEGHNVLVFNPDAGAGQDINAGGTITAFDPDADNPTATMDLTAAYPGITAYTRRIAMPARKAVVIEDTYDLGKPGEAWWFWHTQAQVVIDDDGQSATLSIAGRRLRLTLEANPGAKLILLDARPLPSSPDPEGQNPNSGASLTNSVQENRTKVGVLPSYGEPDPANAIRKIAVHLTNVHKATIRVTATPISG